MSFMNARGVRKQGYSGHFARHRVQAPNFEVDGLGICDGESLQKCRFHAHKRSRLFCRTLRPIVPPTAIPNCAVRTSGLPSGQSSAAPRRLRSSGHRVKCRTQGISNFFSWVASLILASVRTFFCERGSLKTARFPRCGRFNQGPLERRTALRNRVLMSVRGSWDHHGLRGMQTRRS